jgi:hypothetical protein
MILRYDVLDANSGSRKWGTVFSSNFEKTRTNRIYNAELLIVVQLIRDPSRDSFVTSHELTP